MNRLTRIWESWKRSWKGRERKEWHEDEVDSNGRRRKGVYLRVSFIHYCTISECNEPWLWSQCVLDYNEDKCVSVHILDLYVSLGIMNCCTETRIIFLTSATEEVVIRIEADMAVLRLIAFLSFMLSFITLAWVVLWNTIRSHGMIYSMVVWFF